MEINIIIDIVIIAILLISFLYGAAKGLIQTTLKTFSTIIAFILSVALQPVVTGLIKATPIFDMVKLKVAEFLSLTPSESGNLIQSQQTELISSLPLPDFMLELLSENNNSVVYEILDATNTADYICAYLANLIISVCVTLLLIVVIRIILAVILKAADILTKLPVISQFNYLGGGAVGLIKGVLIIWLIFSALLIFVASDSFVIIQENIDASYLGSILYEKNIFKNAIMGGLF